MIVAVWRDGERRANDIQLLLVAVMHVRKNSAMVPAAGRVSERVRTRHDTEKEDEESGEHFHCGRGSRGEEKV